MPSNDGNQDGQRVLRPPIIIATIIHMVVSKRKHHARIVASVNVNLDAIVDPASRRKILVDNPQRMVAE